MPCYDSQSERNYEWEKEIHDKCNLLTRLLCSTLKAVKASEPIPDEVEKWFVEHLEQDRINAAREEFEKDKIAIYCRTCSKEAQWTWHSGGSDARIKGVRKCTVCGTERMWG